MKHAANLAAFCVALLLASGAFAADSPLSLAGPWRFAIDEQNKGVAEQWFTRDLTGAIKLPGTMDDAGLGPKNTKKPTLEGPYRLYDYAGPAWYQRDIEIPENWTNQRITLLLERCRWVTTVWLDDRRIGSQDSLIAPHLYDLGLAVKPGKHRLTICVDNTVKINLGRFVSAMFGGTWGNMNGIIGRIELAATPPVWIDDLQVYPSAAEKSVTVKGRIGNATAQTGSGKLTLSAEFTHIEQSLHAQPLTLDVSWTADGGTFQAKMPLGDRAILWDETRPVVMTLQAALDNGHQKSVNFGLRDFAAQGTQFTLNGRPVFLRGTLECSIWPLTGYPPTDVPAWQRIYTIMKSYGLNHIRFHSWCPPEAAFAAADIEGIMIQAEGPMANVPAGKDPARDAFIEAEFKRIVDTYGNHPSFCTMTLGNEYGGTPELLTRWVDMLIHRDPRHLYSSASSAQKTENRQWTETGGGRGVHGPATERDLRSVVAGDSRPIIGHEIGQWMYWPDPNEIKKWTGVMSLKNYEMIRDDMAAKHLLDQVDQFVQASGKFATLLYKEEIEVLRRTPGYAGFSLLDLHDYPTQGTALIGPLDAFWNSKGFITPEAYSRFCGPTAPLLRIPKRVYTVDETFTATADISHFGPADLPGVQPQWTIMDQAGHVLASGKLQALNVPTGKLTSLGAITTPLNGSSSPAKLTVTLAVGDFSNDWEIWVYPAAKTPEPPTGLVLTRAWNDDAKAALAAGKSVLLFPQKTSRELTLPGRFMPVFWSPVWFPTQKPNTNGILCDPKHPAFAQFPTESHSNWQWYELLNDSRTLILDDTPPDFRPIVQVMDNFARNHKLGNLFEARVSQGKLLVCAIDLPRLADKQPAARQLLQSLYTYAASPQFKPIHELSSETLDKLFTATAGSRMITLGAKVIHADSAHQDHPAANVIDGEPNTLWHTMWGEDTASYPHELVIEFPKSLKLKGCNLLPRQDMPNGRIKTFAIYLSADGKQWGTPVAQGVFKKTSAELIVTFTQPTEARFLKFVALTPQNKTDPYASLAELEVIEASK